MFPTTLHPQEVERAYQSALDFVDGTHLVLRPIPVPKSLDVAATERHKRVRKK